LFVQSFIASFKYLFHSKFSIPSGREVTLSEERDRQIDVEELPFIHSGVLVVEPIPLNEEWFKRMDFIDGDIESLEDFWDEIQAHMYSDITYDKLDKGLLMYVHQAQNIYELLTQKELKFK